MASVNPMIQSVQSLVAQGKISQSAADAMLAKYGITQDAAAIVAVAAPVMEDADCFAGLETETAPLSLFQSIAIPLAERGLKVIPVRGKVAVFDKHPQEATTSIDKITKDWAQYADCNAAVHCLQEFGGAVILDDDGTVDLAALYTAETGKPAPRTRRIINRPIEDRKPFRSHWLFWQTPETIVLKKNIVEGETNHEFSLRVKNYYAVAEGSRHPEHGGIYRAIEDVEIIPMPSDFLAWLVGRANKNSKTGDITKKPEGWINEPIVRGDINNRLTAIAGYYIQNKNINDADALADILIGHADRQAVCKDGVTPYSCNLDEIRTIAHGCASRYKTGEEKKASEVVTFNGVPAGQTATATAEIAKLETDKIPLWDLAVPFRDIEDTPMEWIIPSLIVKGETTMMTGDFGSFKSYMTYFIADAISEGGYFAGREAKQHPVLVLDRENSKSTVSLRRYLVGNLREKTNVKLLGRFTKQQAPEVKDPALLELCRDIRPFIVIDSMQDFHPGRKENDVDDMTEFSQEVNGLIDAGAIGVLIIHHVPKSGKGKGKMYRGTTSIPGGVGGALLVEKVGAFGVKIGGFKTRDGEDAEIELLLRYPTMPEIENKTGRISYTILKSGFDKSADRRVSVLKYATETIQKTGKGLSRNVIAKGVGGDRNEVYGLVNKMVEQGTLTEDAKKLIILPNRGSDGA